MKCWGGNGFGALGQGDTVQRGDGAGEMGNSLVSVVLNSSLKVVPVDAAPARPSNLSAAAGSESALAGVVGTD